MTTVFKFVHVSAIALWAAGLLALPVLYLQRPHTASGPDLHRLHRFVRYFYTVLFSPSAFVAIGSGIALIFLRQTFDPWFTAKLFFVAMMVLLHVLSGLMILRLFEPEGEYHFSRFIIVTVLNILVVTAILALVLGKPELRFEFPFAEAFVPGALGSFVFDHLLGDIMRPTP
ncbi:hypothetical protein EMQ25_02690 [Arsenicitalea aurantiaca]|uniref:Uncharacterized protein n=1 Tax=Arsenicitalea aurantiaca TaxID=1783274 RepID=A0A433XMI4_9HYPH|nr:hypothetical protein EMQ25_02690 [Arsenicitalea aurantiaca]